MISFEFCFEARSTRDVRGFTIDVGGDGRIAVVPWPFVVPRLVGLVAAFEADGYPERLVPVVVPFDARPVG